ncbi:AMP-dependent synthetase/ligase [Cordyceps fumosorosea ARSEF 2679]|uniref:AMP-dependent synthetase/ligase n=1 Tax=Cordyceps fumosorosea (strain ARSEF 2679) TaxID=1081104 RepID=A0A162ME20_CORFA|nr:AMP-dependent synthetase/ligase [Cordyceps fumosorosea ARSEF 2679]OAA54910.1 AMP-dependent synthetase/ligase [Cordyceps fumosorosea ARSEF 2679]
MAAFILDNDTLWSDPEALALRPKKRTRKWATKKRTGCLTCRCAVASRECVGVGYSDPVPAGETNDALDPGALTSWFRQTGLTHQPGVTVSPAGVKTSEQELMQFHFLRQVAASSMAGVFDQTFCSRDMLQATSLHPIVWHASCALAAMYQREALAGATKGGRGADGAAVERQSLRNFALEQYNESIAGVVAVLKSAELSSLDLEVLLTTTLLFTAIASLQGDVPAAVMHVINGQHMLHRWKKKVDSAQATSTGSGRYEPSGLLTPNCVEAVMGRMVSQSSNIRRRPWSEDYYKALETPVISEDPFHSPEDAYYEFEPLSKAYFELGENNKFILDPAQKQPPPRVRSAYAAALAAWTVKFDAMRARPGGVADTPRGREAVLVLQARQICMAIEVQRDPGGPETSWDAFDADFARIVALADRLGAEAGRRRVFSFSSSVMDVLVLTATRCRERGVRRRARELLRRQDAREGLCNSRLGFAIAAEWADIEEAPGRGRRRRRDAEEEEEGGEGDEDGCDCEEDGFICNDHRVAALAGEFRVDDVGTMTYWTKRALDRGLPGEPPLYKGTIPEHFAATVSQHGDRPAVIARSPTPSAHETALSYYELDLLSNRLASSLASLGVVKGDRVAVSLGNGVEFAALTYALFKLGAVLVPLNPSFNAQQVTAALRHLAVEVLVIGAVADTAYRPGRGRSNEPLLEALVGGDLRGGRGVANPDLPQLQTVLVVDNRIGHPGVKFDLDACRRVLTPYRQLLDNASDRPVKPSEPLAADDTINIQFTSGTTSTPKAAQLTHTGILNNGLLIAHRMGLDPGDRIVVPPPLFHCFGSVLGYMATATTGAAILFPSPAFDPVATLRMCVDHDATGLYGVSTMLVAVLEALDSSGGKPPQHLRKGIVAGSSVPESLMRRIYDRLGLGDLVICYGMTETSPVSCMTRPSDALALRCASVGTPMPHTAVKVVDPRDRSRVLPVGERGELAAAGYLVMKGYYGDAARTAEVRVADRRDGTVWMYSGDEAEMDAQGYVRITGRIKDLIIRGGENIHPLEVEDCLFQMPGVKEASVVGLPDDKLGECVAAFVVPRQGWDVEGGGRAGGGGGDEGVLTTEAVREWVRTKLSSHLVPKHVFWVDEYPKTASGKIQKFKLQEQAKTLLAAQGSERQNQAAT